MTEVTIEQFAKQVGGVLPKTLLEQLKRAGVEVADFNDTITDEHKKKLLELLKEEHGESTNQPKQISLKRTDISEIKIKGASGRSSVVSVKRKRRRVYVKREITDEGKKDTSIEREKEEGLVEKSELQQASDLEQLNEVEIEVKVEADRIEKKDEGVKDGKDDKGDKENKDNKKEPLTKGTDEVVKSKEHKDKDKEKDKDKDKSRRKNKGKSSTKEKDGKEREDSSKERRKSKVMLLQETEGRYSRRKPSRIKGKIKKSEEVNPHAFEKPVAPAIHEVKISETNTVAEIAQNMSVKSAEVIKVLMQMGIMATINQVIDQDTACLLVEEMGHKATLLKQDSIEELLVTESSGELEPRTPIVTVMGHVDHGKTSLLDYIRSSKVTKSEAGGITQHIGAYQVDTPKGIITFLDTPGHSAFSAMRARGANCTDVVVLVVAADDGVMPQTIEAIQHAKAANVPIIVAVNKIDKPEADMDKVLNELSQHGLIPESWGGDVIFANVSAKEGTGIDELLESIVLQADLLELKAEHTGAAKGVVLESKLDKGRGPVASVLVQSGVLNKGDMILAGIEYGRVKAMINDSNQEVPQAGVCIPVEILGLSGVPVVGDAFQVINNDDGKAREVALLRQRKDREHKLSRQHATKLDGFMQRMESGAVKTLNVLLKTDVQGSCEAIVDALEKLSSEEIKINIVGRGVGGFNESDINLALTSKAMLLGFNVRADASARRLAQNEGVEIAYYSVIYDVINGVKAAIAGCLGPQYSEKIVGLAEVRDVFRSAKIGAIAGCIVIEGTVKRGKPIRVLRENIVIYQGELESLRRFKENVAEVRNGVECGIGVKNYNDVKVGDQIEVFEMVEVAREIVLD